MPVKDRTVEFVSVTESLQKRQGGAGHLRKTTTPKLAKSPTIRDAITINKLASEIGRETAETALKLKELTKLAKSKSPFSDPTEQIESLTTIVKQDITNIKQKIESLTQYSNRVHGNKQSSDHSTTVIHALNSKLLDTTKEFNDALRVRTQNLKSAQKRREKFSGNRRQGPSPIRPPFDMLDDEEVIQDGDEIAIAVQPLLQTEDSLVTERANAVRDIESHITEIQSIFAMLSNLVALQTDQIKRIEDHMDDTMIYAESALEGLMKYLRTMSSNRGIIIKVFIVLVFFIVVFLLVFA